MNTRSSIGIVATITAISAFVFASVLVHAVFYAPDSEMLIPPEILPPPVATTESKPVRFEIPALSIDASVQHVGINTKGAMMVPSNFRDVAWYKYGTVPGQLGSAVIAGHVDNGLALPGVFRRLGDLRKGDDVYVITGDGSKLRFTVYEIQSYPYDAAPGERVFAAGGAAYLNLVTCSGSWLKSAQTYSERLVVYTKYVDMMKP